MDCVGTLVTPIAVEDRHMKLEIFNLLDYVRFLDSADVKRLNLAGAASHPTTTAELLSLA